MMIKNVLILEDNIKTLQALQKAIEEQYGSLVKVYAVSTYREACLQAIQSSIDVFVLDIILKPKENGDTSGLRFAQELRNNMRYVLTPIFFLTTLSDPGNQALHTVHCFDYLEKPFPPQKAAELVGKALGFFQINCQSTQITLRKDGILYVLDISDILYVRINHHVLNIQLKNDLLSIPNRTLKQFLKAVHRDTFLQCDRSTAVNYQYIQQIDPVNRYISLKGTDMVIDISMYYMKKVLKGFRGV